MITGNILPAFSWVLALNCLQNSMMFTPLAPSAGPIGGEGLAAPPLICNFTIADNSFAILFVCFLFQHLATAHRAGVFVYCGSVPGFYFELEAAKRLISLFPLPSISLLI